MAVPIGLAVEAGKQVIGGLTSIAGSIIGSGKRRREQRQAQAEYDRNMQQFQQQDTSNLYANMENPFADLTVNQQAANFARQQQQQASANIMQNLQGAAGGSGVAALAQTLAQQEAASAQAASADIGRQEAQNQARTAGAAMDLQRMERLGAETARGLELNKRTTLLGMSQERLGAANEARKEATAAALSGVGQLAGGAAMGAAAIAGGKNLAGDKGTGFLGGESGFGKAMGGLLKPPV